MHETTMLDSETYDIILPVLIEIKYGDTAQASILLDSLFNLYPNDQKPAVYWLISALMHQNDFVYTLYCLQKVTENDPANTFFQNLIKQEHKVIIEIIYNYFEWYSITPTTSPYDKDHMGYSQKPTELDAETQEMLLPVLAQVKTGHLNQALVLLDNMYSMDEKPAVYWLVRAVLYHKHVKITRQCVRKVISDNPDNTFFSILINEENEVDLNAIYKYLKWELNTPTTISPNPEQEIDVSNTLDSKIIDSLLSVLNEVKEGHTDQALGLLNNLYPREQRSDVYWVTRALIFQDNIHHTKYCMQKAFKLNPGSLFYQNLIDKEHNEVIIALSNYLNLQIPKSSGLIIRANGLSTFHTPGEFDSMTPMRSSPLLALAELKTGDSYQAFKKLEELYPSQDDEKPTDYWLVRALIFRNESVHSRFCLRKVIELNPGDTFLSNLLSKDIGEAVDDIYHYLEYKINKSYDSSLDSEKLKEILPVLQELKHGNADLALALLNSLYPYKKEPYIYWLTRALIYQKNTIHSRYCMQRVIEANPYDIYFRNLINPNNTVDTTGIIHYLKLGFIESSDSSNQVNYSSISLQNKECPACSETIKASAKKCRYCSEFFKSCTTCGLEMWKTSDSCDFCGSIYGKERIINLQYSQTQTRSSSYASPPIVRSGVVSSLTEVKSKTIPRSTRIASETKQKNSKQVAQADLSSQKNTYKDVVTLLWKCCWITLVIIIFGFIISVYSEDTIISVSSEDTIFDVLEGLYKSATSKLSLLSEVAIDQPKDEILSLENEEIYTLPEQSFNLPKCSMTILNGDVASIEYRAGVKDFIESLMNTPLESMRVPANTLTEDVVIQSLYIADYACDGSSKAILVLDRVEGEYGINRETMLAFFSIDNWQLEQTISLNNAIDVWDFTVLDITEDKIQELIIMGGMLGFAHAPTGAFVIDPVTSMIYDFSSDYRVLIEDQNKNGKPEIVQYNRSNEFSWAASIPGKPIVSEWDSTTKQFTHIDPDTEIMTNMIVGILFQGRDHPDLEYEALLEGMQNEFGLETTTAALAVMDAVELKTDEIRSVLLEEGNDISTGISKVTQILDYDDPEIVLSVVSNFMADEFVMGADGYVLRFREMENKVLTQVIQEHFDNTESDHIVKSTIGIYADYKGIPLTEEEKYFLSVAATYSGKKALVALSDSQYVSDGRTVYIKTLPNGYDLVIPTLTENESREIANLMDTTYNAYNSGIQVEYVVNLLKESSGIDLSSPIDLNTDINQESLENAMSVVDQTLESFDGSNIVDDISREIDALNINIDTDSIFNIFK